MALFKKSILTTLGTLILSMAIAQPGGGGPPGDGEPVPITGIGILVGVGALWGARKVMQLKNKK